MGSVDVNENNTAYNVTLYWDLPSGITNVSGVLNTSYVNITDNNYNYANSNFSFSSLSSMVPGSKAVVLYAYGYNLSGDRIKDVSGNILLSYGINISFTCNNVGDGIYVTACGAADGDYVAPVVTTPGTGSGGGGGGGGSASGSSKSSRADYQFVRGKTNEIKVPFRNNDANITLKNLKFSLSGALAKYMEVVPESLGSLLPRQAINLSIKITSPGFIELGQQTINLKITGDSSGQSYNEEKTIVLQVNDISKDDAQTLISNATKLTEEFSGAGFNDSDVTNLVASMNKAFDALDYSTVQENYNSLSSLIQNALGAKKTISEMNDLIAQAKEKGIDVSGSERIIGLAQLSLERNDFSEAAQRAKEAQTTFALEVKGEIASLSYYLKNNKQEIGMSAVFLFALSFAGYKGARIRAIIRKIKKLKDEEKILQQLMKVVQRQTFTEKKMSMEEYQQSMQYYEKRLSDVIEQLIELESQRAHILRFVGEAKRLKAERMRIIELIKEIQKQYLKEKIIETKSYELRLESYNRRLGQIDEKLATLEAKAALKGVLK